MSLDTQPTQPEPQRISQIQGLSSQEVAERRARGEASHIRFQSTYSLGQIWRENVFTFFILDLLGLTVVLWLLGNTTAAFWNFVLFVIAVLLNLVQDIGSKLWRDRIARRARSKATVIRQGQLEEVDPEQTVLGDVFVAGPGDQILADGQILSDKQITIDESLLTGKSHLVAKGAGDMLYAGSFCVAGRAAYEAQTARSTLSAHAYAARPRTGAPYFTPLSSLFDRLMRFLLAIVAFLIMVLLITYVLVDTESLSPVFSSLASIIFGLAPTSLFFMIIISYAFSSVYIVLKGQALMQQTDAAESLSYVDTICFDKTGVLTTNRVDVERVEAAEGRPAAERGPDLTEPELHRVLGDYARSGTAGHDRINRAIADTYPGLERPVHEEVGYSLARGWSALSFEEDALRGTYVLGSPEVLRPALAVDANALVPPVRESAADREQTPWWRTVLSDAQNLAQRLFAGSGADETVEQSIRTQRPMLFAYRPDVTPLHDPSGWPQLPTGLIPLCFLGISEVLRPGANQMLKAFSKAGVQIKVLSGDRLDVVADVAVGAGLEAANGGSLKTISGADLAEVNYFQLLRIARETTVFGQVKPGQKAHIVQALRDQGRFVAMVGDGTNDIPAMQETDLSIAMQSGSEATRSIADILLLDDSLAALPETFRQGQVTFSGIFGVLRLYLVRLIYLAMLIVTGGLLGVLLQEPAQGSIVVITTLALPTLTIFLLARPLRVRKQSVMGRLAHFAVPAGVLTGIAGIGIFLFFLANTGDLNSAQVALTYALVIFGLLLYLFVEPPSQAWVGGDKRTGCWLHILVVLGLYALFEAVVRTQIGRELFQMEPLRGPLDYLVIGLVVLVWVIVLRYTWRHRLVERYLRLDFTDPLEGDGMET